MHLNLFFVAFFCSLLKNKEHYHYKDYIKDMYKFIFINIGCTM
jgi:hypothetical protein